MTRGVIRRYFDRLPVDDRTPIVSLDEGDTPLILSSRLSDEIGAEVWLKYEGLNPTGSFKDRGMTVAISKALEERAEAVLCASTGNTSASAAAYAARAGITCGVLIPRGKVALGKLSQALVHGARVFSIDGNFDRALELTRAVSTGYAVTLVNSVNPYRIEGQKTAAFEVVEALGRFPDLHVMPVGNAGNITAYWKGYREARAGAGTALPRMIGVQAAGADPLVRGTAIADPQTRATAIRIGNPASWRGAEEAVSESAGRILSVSEEEIIGSYRALAREGLYVELASAAGVAGLRRLAAEGEVVEGSTIVCILTGHGLKDPDAAVADAPAPATIGDTPAALARALQLA